MRAVARCGVATVGNRLPWAACALAVAVVNWALPSPPALAATPQTASISGSTSISRSIAIKGGADAVAARGGTVAVITASTRTVSVIDSASLALRASVTLEQIPSSIALSPDGSLAYVATSQPTKYQGASSNGISVIDTSTGAVLRSMTYPADGGCAGDGLRGLITSPDGTQLHGIIGCISSATSIWTVDPATLTVVSQAPTWKAFSSPMIGRPIGLAASTSGTYASAYWPVLKCFELDGCPPPPVIMSINGDTATALQPGPAPASLQLGRLISNDADSTLLVLAPEIGSLLIVNPSTGSVTSTIGGLGQGASDLALDPSAKRVYVANAADAKISVIDLATRTTLGAISLPGNTGSVAVIPASRGYVTTGTGLTAFDLTTPVLLPTAPSDLVAKVKSIGKGKVRATITWSAPAASGTSPISSYQVAVREGPTCSTKKTACTITMRRQKGHYDANRWWVDAYSFTVTAVNKAGPGSSARIDVRYPDDF